MIEDVYEPLAKYRDEFRESFARRTREKFLELTERSGVDVAANRRLVARVRALEEKVRRVNLRRFLFGLLAVLCLVGVVAALVGAKSCRAWKPEAFPQLLAAAAAAAALGIFAFVRRRKADAACRALTAEIEALKKSAWEQMEPLNRLYAWDIPVKLIEATVPRLAFDPYFTSERLVGLRTRYGWDDAFNEGKSMLFSQSGVINGNPFVFAQYLDMKWVEKTYEGTKDISWTEWDVDADGKRRLVRRHETLHASVSRPFPEYAEHKVLVYGNDAAPDLSFSREPSGLEGEGAGFFARWRARRRMKRMEAFSRNLDDESQFTMMANKEFETWFGAMDRDDEVGFRLLFTPVAQTQMMALMKDATVGYGDDFSFRKRRKVNELRSRHLDEGVIDTDPARFRNWDWDAAAAFFSTFNERYFKDVYFSLAPVLAVPLYQQLRPVEDIWKDVLGRGASSFWEHETLANYYGEESFRHPDCVTRSLLKTRVTAEAGEDRTVEVTANGHRGEPRVAYERVRGGDGDWHEVPVHWTEYLPVSRTRRMHLTERAAPSDGFRNRASAAAGSAYRRAILSFLD